MTERDDRGICPETYADAYDQHYAARDQELRGLSNSEHLQRDGLRDVSSRKAWQERTSTGVKPNGATYPDWVCIYYAEYCLRFCQQAGRWQGSRNGESTHCDKPYRSKQHSECCEPHHDKVQPLTR